MNSLAGVAGVCRPCWKPLLWGSSQPHCPPPMPGWTYDLGWPTMLRSLYNNIIPPSRLSPGSDLHLFREGIEPKWEDPKCEAGGSWKVMVPKGQKQLLDTMWLHAVSQPVVSGEDVGGSVAQGSFRGLSAPKGQPTAAPGDAPA